ncbi:hypothetical protein, partial [Herbaspirillum sp.]|uniref:hypothetical protein n=1 Tax=Herbaspirillum sp. TaxID=1890675 RepID=UPI002585DC3C
EEIMSDKEEFDVIYSVRIWITMIGVGIQSLCVFLLFPFAEKEYQCLCRICIKSCGGGRHRRTMEDYQRF